MDLGGFGIGDCDMGGNGFKVFYGECGILIFLDVFVCVLGIFY